MPFFLVGMEAGGEEMLMRERRPGWGSVLSLVVALAVGAWLLAESPVVAQEETSGQEAEESQEAEEIPEAGVPLVIPDEEKKRENPFEDDEEALALGKKLYSSQCAMCHGEKGLGDGDLAADMQLAVPDFTNSKSKEKTDGEFFYILSKGHGSMPAQDDRMPEKNRWSLINHIRALESAAAADE
jgi:mono/diheme cytochrome c family protein